jgi:5-methylcytosine-specific restriction endonuclease McrA
MSEASSVSNPFPSFASTRGGTRRPYRCPRSPPGHTNAPTPRHQQLSRMAHPKLQTVWERYALCCGYCGVSEADVGGEVTVDHFRPVSAGGNQSDANLVYACVRCNQYKGALLPEAMDLTQERRLLHPLQDDIAAHIRKDENTGRLQGLTSTGHFHIEARRLNRPALVVHRQRRALAVLLEARVVFDQTAGIALIERHQVRSRSAMITSDRGPTAPSFAASSFNRSSETAW